MPALNTHKRTWTPLLFLLVLSIALSLATENFLNVRNLLTILVQIAVVGILAIGQTYVMLTAGIDLSIGGILGLSGVICALLLTTAGLSIPFAFILASIAGLLCGLLNGLLITKIRIPPFIATLGTMSVTRGVALVLTGGVAVYNLPEGFDWIGRGTLFGIPFPVLLMISITITMSILLHRTTLGRYAKAIGGNEEAAWMSGVPVQRTLMKVYGICGLLAGVAGVVQASRVVTGQPTAGLGYELDAIAAAVIGGTSLFGGVGTVWGSLTGAALMGVIRNGCNLLNITAFWQQIVIGSIIWIAVAWDSYQRRNA